MYVLSVPFLRRHSRPILGTVLSGLILAIVFVCWMVSTGRHSLADLQVPVNYSGDALGVLALIKAYAAGDIWPFVLKQVSALGAPFGANWTDYPTEDLVFFVAGLFARVFGLFAGANLYLVAVQALAGISFLIVCMAMRYSLAASFAGAVLFALSPYAFSRTLDHLSLTTYWHVPLFLFGIVWASGRLNTSSEHDNRYYAALAVFGALITGLLNVYYLAIFGWVIGWVWIGAAVARNRTVFLRTSLLLALAIFGFALQSVDTVWMDILYGANWHAANRDLRGLDQFGMRLPDLALPYIHRWSALQSWARETYHSVAPGGGMNRGEAMRAYMGVFPFWALFAMLVSGTIRLAARQFDKVSDWYWPSLAIISFSVVGGINYLFGALGFVLLRATNRYSIVLVAIALLWLCGKLTNASTIVRFGLVAAMLTIGPWDQVPKAGVVVPEAEYLRPGVMSDAAFVKELESKLPKGAMVLQLPIKAFPESGFIHKMSDYEHFRPYLYSKDLRFSYGTTKGRGDSAWQFMLVGLPLHEVVGRAVEYGFSAIYVNRNAYVDRAAGMIEQLSTELGAPIANRGDLIAFRLPPASGPPVLPPVPPTVSYAGFSYVEQSGGHIWSWAVDQRASMVVSPPYRGMHNSPDPRDRYELSFIIESFNGGAVDLDLGGRRVATLAAGQGGRQVKLLLPPGQKKWHLVFWCDRPPISPGKPDPRKLTFRIRDMEMSPISPKLSAQSEFRSHQSAGRARRSTNGEHRPML